MQQKHGETMRIPARIKIPAMLCKYPIARDWKGGIEWISEKGNSSLSYYKVPGCEAVSVHWVKRPSDSTIRPVTATDVRMLFALIALSRRYGQIKCSMWQLCMVCLGDSDVPDYEDARRAIELWSSVRIEVDGLKSGVVVKYKLEQNPNKNTYLWVIDVDEKLLSWKSMHVCWPITGKVLRQNLILRTLWLGSCRMGRLEFFISAGVGRHYLDWGMPGSNKRLRLRNALKRVSEWYANNGGAFNYKIIYEPPKIAMRRPGKGRRQTPREIELKVVRP